MIDIIRNIIIIILYFDKEKTTTKNRKKKILLTNGALIVYALGMLTPINTELCLIIAYILMIVVCVWETKKKEKL